MPISEKLGLLLGQTGDKQGKLPSTWLLSLVFGFSSFTIFTWHRACLFVEGSLLVVVSKRNQRDIHRPISGCPRVHDQPAAARSSGAPSSLGCGLRYAQLSGSRLAWRSVSGHRLAFSQEATPKVVKLVQSTSRFLS